jgi:Heavy metal associated domain 2
MSSPGGLRIAHHHPGRLRVRAEAFVDNSNGAKAARAGVVRIHGVRSASFDARTGSLLVEYEPREVGINALVARIGELSGLEVLSPSADGSAADRIQRFARKLDAATRSLTGNRLDLGVVIPGGLVGVAVYSFLKSSHTRVPRWDSLVYWAYSVFVHASHASGARTRQ